MSGFAKAQQKTIDPNQIPYFTFNRTKTSQDLSLLRICQSAPNCSMNRNG